MFNEFHKPFQNYGHFLVAKNEKKKVIWTIIKHLWTKEYKIGEIMERGAST